MKILNSQIRISGKLRAMLLALALFVGTQNVLCMKETESTVSPARTQESLLDGSGISSDKIFNILSKAIRTAVSMNYFKDTGVTFDFMGNKVSLDWGFAGSGDIFKPLEAITPNLGLVKDQDGQISMASVVTTLALKQWGEKTEIGKSFKWLSDFKLTPLHLFGLKLMLLVKSLDGEQDASYLFEEVACLLFRLSLVDDLSLLDKSKPLTSYFPESLNSFLSDIGFGLSDFINQVWGTIVCNKLTPTEFTMKKPVTVHSFVFLSKKLAQDSFEKFKDYKGHNFCQEIEAFGKDKFQIVSSSQFKDVDGEVSVNDTSVFQPFAKNLVDYRELHLDSNTFVGSGIEKELIRNIKTLDGKEGVFYFEETGKNKFWVSQVSYDNGVVGSLKSLILTFARTFKEYVSVKKSLYEGSDSAARQYRTDVNKREKERKELESFTRSSEGKAAFEDLCKQVKDVVSTSLQDNAMKKWQSGKAEIEKEIARLEGEITAKRQQQAKYEQMLALDQGQQKPATGWLSWMYAAAPKVNYGTVEQNVRFTEEIAKLAEQVKAKRQELSAIEYQLVNIAADNDLSLKEKHMLERLKKVVQDRQATGMDVPEKVFDKIAELEQKIAVTAQQKQSKIKLEDNLAVREKVAQIFERKAAELKKAMEQRSEEISKMTDEDEKIIQEVLLEETKSLTEKFITRLEVVAKEIRENSEKAKKLSVLRRSDKISGDDRKRVDSLELEVGHILDGDSHENFIGTLMMRSSMFNEFIRDMINAGDSEVRFSELKQRITDSVKCAVEGSDTVKDNLIVLKYIMQYMPASVKALLRISGAGQLVGA